MTALVIAIVAVAAVTLLYQALRGDINKLDTRVHKLEEAKQKRVNYQTLEEIENAMAELAIVDMDLDIKKERVASIRAHLSKAHTPTKKD